MASSSATNIRIQSPLPVSLIHRDKSGMDPVLSGRRRGRDTFGQKKRGPSLFKVLAQKEKGPFGPFPLLLSRKTALHVHPAHAAHVGHAAMGVSAPALLLFHQLRDHRVG